MDLYPVHCTARSNSNPTLLIHIYTADSPSDADPMRMSPPTPPPVFTALDSRHSRSTGDFNPGDPTPKYDLSLSREFRQWKAADEASKKLLDLSPVLDDLKKDLEISQNELKLLKEKSAKLFHELHSNTSPKMLSFISRKPKRESTAEHTEAVKTSFEIVHQTETKKAEEVQQMESQVSELSKKFDELIVMAAQADDAWTQLQHTMNAMARTDGDSKAIYSAEDHVLNSEAAFDLATNAVKDMTRARQTIQHAHHYFQTALRTYDAIRGPMSKTIGSFGEMGRRNDYRECVSFSERAQACLDECFRVMESYLYTLPEDRRADHDALKELGLMQMQKIENVLYGGDVMTSSQGSAASVKLMISKQEKAFAHLTALAVWVQDRVPVVEQEKRIAEEARKISRRELADLWSASLS